MIFAAGLGTRLKPLTDHQPKALVPVAGRPMLEHVILKLKKAGFNELVINIHHFGEQIIDFLKANQNFLQLQEEISDLENKLAAVRRYFNSATKELNNAVETFPSNLIAGMFGFKKEVMFDLGEQRATLEEAPKIKF